MADASLIALGRSVLRPSDTGDVVDWMAANVTAIPGSPFSGPYNPERYPWVAAALRITTDPSVSLCLILASIQSGKTLTLGLTTCHIASRQPGPTLVLQDNDQNARDFNLITLRPLWDNCPAVKDRLVPELDRSSTILFDRMTCWVLGAHNDKNLQRRSIRWLIGDECWLWPKGHMAEASARVTAFGWMGKRIFASQGGIAGDDFDLAWQSTDRRDWHFRCPKCDSLQPWVWEQVRFPEDAKSTAGWDKLKVAKGTTYECVSCRERLPDTNGTRITANERGEFIATGPASISGHVGLHWNSLAQMSWGELGVMMLEASEAAEQYGDNAPRRIFKQKRLAMPWSEEGGTMITDAKASEYKLADAWDDEATINARGKLQGVDSEKAAGSIPFRTMGIDVQRGHFWAVIRSWSLRGESRMRYFGKVETWQELDALAKVHNVNKGLVMVDSGDQTQLVYSEASKRDWKVSKGSGQEDFTVKGGRRIYSDPQRVAVPGAVRAARLILFSAVSLKDILHGLRMRKLHTFPLDAPSEYAEQMDAEVRVRDKRTGKAMWILPQGKKDNHALDCEVLSMLVAIRWGIVGRDKADDTSTETSDAI